MGEPFSDKEFEILFGFIGYGTMNADYWFIGMEEGGGGEENLRARLGFSMVEDLKEGHQKLGITKFHTGKKAIQSTWAGMCRIMLALEGKAITTENVREYQANKLGRKDGNTLLAELMPLPKPHINDWGYDALFPKFSSYTTYYSVIKRRRLRLLEIAIGGSNPKCIICYGKKFWDDYKYLFRWQSFEQHGIFSVSQGEKTTVILTDHFVARSMNGQFENVANLIREISR